MSTFRLFRFLAFALKYHIYAACVLSLQVSRLLCTCAHCAPRSPPSANIIACSHEMKWNGLLVVQPYPGSSIGLCTPQGGGTADSQFTFNSTSSSLYTPPALIIRSQSQNQNIVLTLTQPAPLALVPLGLLHEVRAAVRALDAVVVAQLHTQLVCVLLPVELAHPAADAEARVVEHAVDKAVGAGDGVVDGQARAVAQRVCVRRQLCALEQDRADACALSGTSKVL